MSPIARGEAGDARANGAPVDEVHLFWLEGMSCGGCTVAMASAQSPSLEDLVRGAIPGLPTVQLHHSMFSEGSGSEFTQPLRAALEGELGAPYLVVLEGSVPDDQAMARGQGYFAAIGSAAPPRKGAEHQPAAGGRRQPARMTDWLKLLAPGAAAMVAIGTCATWGGIPAAAGNITGSMSLMDFLGPSYQSTAGLPVINVPGCAPIGDNFTETLSAVLLHLADQQALPEFDELGRPAWQFAETVHRHCPRAGYYEEGTFAEEYGDHECLVTVGCWGPVVQCNIVERGAVNHVGGCMVAGGPCIGCTMPGFPDKYSPFYKKPPGTAISGGASRVYGGAIRRLRRMSMRKGNREPIWDNAGAVPTGWAREHGEPTYTEKTMEFFYKKLQYFRSVDQSKRNKRQPLPKSLDILRQEGLDFEQSVPVLQEPVKSPEEL